MTRSASHADKIWNRLEHLPPRPLDLELLGASIRFVSPAFWEPGMLFAGAPDEHLKALTLEFPRTLRPHKSTHPLFVLKTLSNIGHKVCPCSSRDWGVRRFIRKGCVQS